MNFKDVISETMTILGKNPKTVFIGYCVRYGGRFGGTLEGVSDEQKIETPLAENLMAGVAIGMSLRGKISVLCVERSDFLLNALDAIVNHLDKIAELSDGLHKPACIIRVVIGNSKTPLFTGATHTQDFCEACKLMVKFPVSYVDIASYGTAYAVALKNAERGVSTMLFERKDNYNL